MNSPLVDVVKISPYKNSPRNHKIDTITIHCMVAQWSPERCGEEFSSPNRRASSNYGIGPDGRIGMYVEEQDRSWCSNSPANDNRAITIEVASATKHPYAVTDAAYEALIKLVADICKRNDIKELKWRGDKRLIGQIDKQNMTVHRWFANKACPGDYLYSRHGEIAARVNALLKGQNGNDETLYRVQTGAFTSQENAEREYDRVKAKGFDAIIVKADNMYKVQVGAYREETGANKTADDLRAKGFDVMVTTKAGTIVPRKKSNEQIAKEVVDGLWGNGAARKKALTEAGYDYATIQKLVNRMC